MREKCGGKHLKWCDARDGVHENLEDAPARTRFKTLLFYQNHILVTDRNSSIPPSRHEITVEPNPTMIGGKSFLHGEHEIPLSR